MERNIGIDVPAASLTLAVISETGKQLRDFPVEAKGIYLTTPADIQNKFANMVRGSYKQGAYQPFQMGYLRPNQECSQYRTPVGRLYLGGASAAPGGMVIFGPGYNCSNAIAEDSGIERWWKEQEYMDAREADYI